MASRTLAPKVWPRNDTGHLCSHFTGQADGGATLNFKGAVGTDVPPHHGRRRLGTTRRESKPDEGPLEQDSPGRLKDVAAGPGWERPSGMTTHGLQTTWGGRRSFQDLVWEEGIASSLAWPPGRT